MVILYILLLIGFIILLRWYNSPGRKGKRGEEKVSKTLLELSDDYHILNDIVFQTSNGTTQIDHIVVSKYGVFAIETKNYRGKIYGDDNREKWMQIIVTKVTYSRKWWKTYTYVTKNQFYNPVKQSIGHAYRIKSVLKDYKHLPIVPIVVFVGEADITNVNTNHKVIYVEQLLSVIERYKTTYLSDEDYQEVIRILEDNNVRETVDDKTHANNVKSVKRQKQDTINSGICPQCGGKLKLRNGKFGSFYGCSNYPKCRFTVNVD